jgi:hypothetical protein
VQASYLNQISVIKCCWKYYKEENQLVILDVTNLAIGTRHEMFLWYWSLRLSFQKLQMVLNHLSTQREGQKWEM